MSVYYLHYILHFSPDARGDHCSDRRGWNHRPVDVTVFRVQVISSFVFIPKKFSEMNPLSFFK